MRPYLFAVVGLAVAAPALGSSYNGFYVGLEGNIASIEWNAQFSPRPGYIGGLAMRAGYRYEMFGAELGWETAGDDYDTPTACTGPASATSLTCRSRLSYNAATLDGFYYLSMPGTDWFQLFATGGIMRGLEKDRTIARGEITTPKTGGGVDVSKFKNITVVSSSADFRWRIGAGAEIHFLKDFAFRVTGRYVPFGFGGAASSGFSVNFGLFSRF